ncbi:MAG: hypothetical protein JO275_12410 [Verrucomicrobia bacterium]|nr:hypothetical protein [Verrucomicrobiota bacterium]
MIEVICGAAATGKKQTVTWQNATWLVRRRYVAIAAPIADAPDLQLARRSLPEFQTTGRSREDDDD